MKVFRRAKALRSYLAQRRSAVALVPTMGALHAGHLSLVKRAKQDAGQVVVSIFVNPTQFGPREDFKAYPRDLVADVRLLATCGPLAVYAPDVSEIYPRGFSSQIQVHGPLAKVMEAKARPGHFDGVATVVARLFGLVQARRAYFGLKDYQQFRVISRMTHDLGLPVRLIGCPTLRAKDGLALSSRNAYLSADERAVAPCLRQALLAVAAELRRGQRDPRKALALGRRSLGRSRLGRLQYLEIGSADDLAPLKRAQGKLVIAGAFWLGKARLIDNLVVNL